MAYISYCNKKKILVSLHCRQGVLLVTKAVSVLRPGDEIKLGQPMHLIDFIAVCKHVVIAII